MLARNYGTKRVSFKAAAQKRKRPYSNGNGGSLPKRQRLYQSRALANLRSGGQLGIELKFLDVPHTASALTAPTDWTGAEIQPTSVVTGCLSAPAQGDSPQNREGRKISIRSILLQGAISINAQAAQATADIAPTIFCALVLDTQTNGVTINSEDVYSNPSASATTNCCPLRNMSFSQRFKVLKTWTWHVPQLELGNDAGKHLRHIPNGH